MRPDQAKGILIEAWARLGGRVLEESIHEPIATGGEKAVERTEVELVIIDAVETADIERQVEATISKVKRGDVAQADLGNQAGGAQFAAGEADGRGSEVDAGHLPAMPCERNNVGPSSTAEINGAARRMIRYELQQFGRGDSAVPRGVEQIPEAKLQASKHRLVLAGERVADLLGIDLTNHPPEFRTLGIEKDVGGRVFEVVHRRQLASHRLLDVDAKDDERAAQFLFEPVHDGFLGGAGNSVGGLELEQDRLAGANHGLDRLGIASKTGLPWMQDEP